MEAIPAVYADSSPEIQVLVRDRPDYWEFLLSSRLLRDILTKGRDKLACLDEGILTTPCEYLADLETCMKRALVLMEDFKRLTGSINPILGRLMQAWGSAGEPSDPVRIHDACGHFASTIDGIIRWEIQYRALRYPDEYKPLFAPFVGLAPSLFKAVEVLPDKLLEIVETSKKNPERRKFTFEIEYAPKVQWDRAMREINSMIDSYERKAKRRNSLFGFLFS
jgi:hypothetical protein